MHCFKFFKWNYFTVSALRSNFSSRSSLQEKPHSVLIRQDLTWSWSSGFFYFCLVMILVFASSWSWFFFSLKVQVLSSLVLLTLILVLLVMLSVFWPQYLSLGIFCFGWSFNLSKSLSCWLWSSLNMRFDLKSKK